MLSLSELENMFSFESDKMESLFRPDHFWKQLRSCLASYNPNVYRSPYFTMVQSSGCGKSRAVKEAALVHPLIYVTLDYQRAYPRGQRMVKSDFAEINSVDAGIRMLIRLLRLGKYLWIKHAATNSNPKRAFWLSMEKLSSEDWAAVPLDRDDTMPVKSCKAALEDYLKTVGASEALLVIDEAQSLMEHDEDHDSPFVHLREALRAVDCGPKLAALYVSSSISIICDPSVRPSAFQDPSQQLFDSLH